MRDRRPLDQTDFDILSQLQSDARISNKDLASQIQLAPSSCLERVRRLQADGVLTGFHAAVDPGAVGIGLQAMIAVQLGDHSSDGVQSFTEAMSEHPAVLARYYLAGRIDFLVHVAVRDTTHLRQLAVDEITARPEVEQVETMLIFDHQARSHLPVYLAAQTNGRANGTASATDAGHTPAPPADA